MDMLKRIGPKRRLFDQSQRLGENLRTIGN